MPADLLWKSHLRRDATYAFWSLGQPSCERSSSIKNQLEGSSERRFRSPPHCRRGICIFPKFPDTSDRTGLQGPHFESHCPMSVLPWWLSDKASNCNAGDLGSIPGSGRSPGGGNDNQLQYSCQENPKDRRAWGLQSLGTNLALDRIEHAHMHSCPMLFIHSGSINLGKSFPLC